MVQGETIMPAAAHEISTNLTATTIISAVTTLTTNVTTNETSPVHGEEMPFGNLYKLYLIQAGMVIFPVFFVWMIAKRARVEEVQMLMHHRDHHNQEHPEEPQLALSDALILMR